MCNADPPKIVLAPMEGVIDAPMRAFLTGLGGYLRCVTEFIRVTDVRLPERVFLRLCPELARGGLTEGGVPVYCQLLGSDARALADNAVRAISLGAPGVDLNFGCPAKTVNNSMGGSVLLQYPERVGHIVRVVRDTMPAHIPLTVKIRLGYDSTQSLADIVGQIREAGASELAIHARTKFDGYKPPAWWDLVRPVVSENHLDSTYINGEIWTVHDSIQARRASGCRHLMLGRGALASPDLALRIRRGARVDSNKGMPWHELLEHIERQFHRSDCNSERHTGNRTKQWLGYLKRTYPEATQLFDAIRRLHDVPGISEVFRRHRKLLLRREDRV